MNINNVKVICLVVITIFLFLSCNSNEGKNSNSSPLNSANIKTSAPVEVIKVGKRYKFELTSTITHQGSTFPQTVYGTVLEFDKESGLIKLQQGNEFPYIKANEIKSITELGETPKKSNLNTN